MKHNNKCICFSQTQHYFIIVANKLNNKILLCLTETNKFIHSISAPPNAHIYKCFHIKTLKIAPTCFDPKIIFRELCCSLLKSRVTLARNKILLCLTEANKFIYSIQVTRDFSKEQRSSLKMILGSKHVRAILSVLMWKKFINMCTGCCAS